MSSGCVITSVPACFHPVTNESDTKMNLKSAKVVPNQGGIKLFCSSEHRFLDKCACKVTFIINQCSCLKNYSHGQLIFFWLHTSHWVIYYDPWSWIWPVIFVLCYLKMVNWVKNGQIGRLWSNGYTLRNNHGYS